MYGRGIVSYVYVQINKINMWCFWERWIYTTTLWFLTSRIVYFILIYQISSYVLIYEASIVIPMPYFKSPIQYKMMYEHTSNNVRLFSSNHFKYDIQNQVSILYEFKFSIYIYKLLFVLCHTFWLWPFCI